VRKVLTGPRKVDYKKFQKFVEKNLDKTLKEIGERFKISTFASRKIIRKLNIAYKKTLSIRGKAKGFERRISNSSKSNS